MDINRILFVFLLTMIIYTIIRICIDSEYDGYPIQDYHKTNFKTGDIIVFKWWYSEEIFRFFSKYHHVGIVTLEWGILLRLLRDNLISIYL